MPAVPVGRGGQPSIVWPSPGTDVAFRLLLTGARPGDSCQPYLTPPHGTSGPLPSKALLKEPC